MTSIQLTLTGPQAQAQVSGVLTAGMVGVAVYVDCDSAWDGLTKTLVCRCNGVRGIVEQVERRTLLASGVLQWDRLGRNELFLGVEGRNAEGDLVIPSTMAFCGRVYPSADLSDEGTQRAERESVQYVNVPEKVRWHQCPEGARRFVEEIRYDPSDLSVSAVADYLPVTASDADYRPVERTVAGRTFCNQVPGVETAFVAEGAFGTVEPLDPVRFINTAFARNVRDLGGWACDGGRVKYGLLFRGGFPTAADRPVLVEELGIRHDLDLRGGAEAPVIEASLLGADVHFTQPKNYNMYTLDDTQTWRENLTAVFDAVAHNEPMLFHCSAGADRTGTLACVLEGLLGVSTSDIDKDYELTSFYSLRQRNGADWQKLIGQINARPGDSFRDRCVDFVGSLGFTAAQINAFRAAMIDGTPEQIQMDSTPLNVYCTLPEGINSDNEQQTLTQYQSYETQIQCVSGIVIRSVKVTMGGSDITASVWKGTPANLMHSVKADLKWCKLDNVRQRVVDGQGYVAYVTADTGYGLNGAQVKITMGGQDMAKYYSSGVIAIPNVTGDLEITIVAAGQAAVLDDQMVVQTGNLNKRISGVGIVGYNGCFVTDPIAVDLSVNCPVMLKGFQPGMSAMVSGSIYGQGKLALLDSSKNVLAVWYMGKMTASGMMGFTEDGEDMNGELSEVLSVTPTAGTLPTESQVAYVQFAPQIAQSSQALTMSDLEGLEIRMLAL